MEDAVSLELLVEGEHCSLGLGLDVASAAAPTKEDAGGWGSGGGGWEGSRDGCWEGRGAWEATIVACAAAAGVVVGALVDGGAFSKLEGHCSYLVGGGGGGSCRRRRWKLYLYASS